MGPEVGEGNRFVWDYGDGIGEGLRAALEGDELLGAIGEEPVDAFGIFYDLVEVVGISAETVEAVVLCDVRGVEPVGERRVTLVFVELAVLEIGEEFVAGEAGAFAVALFLGEEIPAEAEALPVFFFESGEEIGRGWLRDIEGAASAIGDLGGRGKGT